MECDRCAGTNDTSRGMVVGRGRLPCDVLLVGQGPSVSGSNVTGSPFVGDRSGRVLSQCLREVGLLEYDLFVTNATKCALPRNGRPGRRQVEMCRPYLDKEIEDSGDAVLVPMGRVAAEALMPRPLPPLRDIVGHVTQRGDGRLVFPTYHPAYVVRGVVGVEEFRAHFHRLAMVLAARR